MKIKNIKNLNCNLNVIENLKNKNFVTKRIFFLNSNKKCIRGNHAHKKCTQIFISLKGKIKIFIENSKGSRKILLKEFKKIIKIPPMNWVKIEMEKNQTLMVICDKNFSERDYIRNYQSFLKKIKK